MVVHTTSAGRDALGQAIALVPGSKKGCVAQMKGLIARLADFGYLRSPDQWNAEGNGLYAVKARCGLRAYGWFASESSGKVFVIGHATLKKNQKADPQDLQKTQDEREQYLARGLK